MMQNTDSLKLMQALFASYEQGVQSISPVFSVAAMFLGENFNRETEKNLLRETLARNGNLRKKDFDQMLDGLADVQQKGAQETHDLLHGYIRGQQETIRQLSGYFAEARQYMAGGDLPRIKLTLVQIKKIIAQQEQAGRELENELVEFEKERNEINLGIKCLLQKGRELRVRDFKEMLAKIKRQRKNRIEENKLRRETVGRMLADFNRARSVIKQQRINNMHNMQPGAAEPQPAFAQAAAAGQRDCLPGQPASLPACSDMRNISGRRETLLADLIGNPDR